MVCITYPNIPDQRSERVVDYCKPGNRILIEYPHGFGDLLLFYPFFEAFKREHEDCKIDLKPNDGLLPLCPHCDDPNTYDYVFRLPAYFNENIDSLSRYTKPECNVLLNLGCEYQPELEYTFSPKSNSNIVGFSFFNSSYPRELNCPYNTARRLWEMAQESGFIAVELFLPKPNFKYKQLNDKYSFIDWSMRTKGIGIKKLIGLMCSLCGIAAVATGNFHYAMTRFPEKTLYLKNKWAYSYFTNKEVLSLDVNKPDYGVAKEWIRRLQS